MAANVQHRQILVYVLSKIISKHIFFFTLSDDGCWLFCNQQCKSFKVLFCTNCSQTCILMVVHCLKVIICVCMNFGTYHIFNCRSGPFESLRICPKRVYLDLYTDQNFDIIVTWPVEKWHFTGFEVNNTNSSVHRRKTIPFLLLPSSLQLESS